MLIALYHEIHVETKDGEILIGQPDGEMWNGIRISPEQVEAVITALRQAVVSLPAK